MGARPEFVVVDYETEIGGLGSTEYWRPEFRVSSAAFSWVSPETGEVRSEFVERETGVHFFLERVVAAGIPLVAHNVQFEMGVTQCRFPDLAERCVWLADTMRLVQNYDNGGDAFAPVVLTLDAELDAVERGDEPDEVEWIGGLGLVNAVRRLLNEPDHKAEAYAWIRANVEECRPGREGQFLTRLPRDLLVRYNVGDTEATLRLYLFVVRTFETLQYDWTLDHALYLSSVRRIVAAQIRGVRVDREALALYGDSVRQEIAQIGVDFREHFSDQILAVERQRLLDEVRERKTLRGRKSFVRRYRAGAERVVDAVRFNVGSNLQLAALFVGQMGMEPRFRTDKGAPAFRSAVLGQWGEGGEMLKKRRKRLLVLKQTENLLALSAADGRWHAALRAAGTATGRFSGGSHS